MPHYRLRAITTGRWVDEEAQQENGTEEFWDFLSVSLFSGDAEYGLRKLTEIVKVEDDGEVGN